MRQSALCEYLISSYVRPPSNSDLSIIRYSRCFSRSAIRCPSKSSLKIRHGNWLIMAKIVMLKYVPEPLVGIISIRPSTIARMHFAVMKYSISHNVCPSCRILLEYQGQLQHYISDLRYGVVLQNLTQSTTVGVNSFITISGNDVLSTVEEDMISYNSRWHRWARFIRASRKIDTLSVIIPIHFRHH